MANLRVMAILMVLVVGLLFAIDYYTTSQPGVSADPITEEAITGQYPELYRDIYRRDAPALRPWLTHSDSVVRAQAWRALANTPVDSTGWMVDLVLERPSPQAWFALGMHELEETQLRRLENLWEELPGERGGLSLVLGRRGGEAALDFMMGRMEQADDSGWEEAYALGLSRLITRHPLTADQQIRVLRQAFDDRNTTLVRRYLYGFYRGPETPLGEEALSRLRTLWQGYGMGVAGVDQYAVALLGERIFHDVTVFYNADEMLEYRIQLAVELAGVLGGVTLDDRHMLDASFLVRHENALVRRRALQSLRGRLDPSHNLYGYVSGELLDSETEPGVWLEALDLVAAAEGEIPAARLPELEAMMEREPYCLDRALGILREHRSAGAYLDRVVRQIERGEPLRTRFAVQSLAGWESARGEELSGELRGRIRSAAFQALETGDRGVAYALRGLFAREELFGADDFGRIREGLSAFRLPEDIEVFQAFGSLFYERFRQVAEASAWIDSLAAEDYPPLNRSLAEAGWDVEMPEAPSVEFREIGWERLWEMGRHPVWELRTDKGIIAVRMDLLGAPATVSAVDSLTMSGAYNGIPFHRVVPNFVIQGGDVERADGLGGPDFVIPTEGSERAFGRGAVGIASAGTDTEGSQYFIMHQWSPHLNGSYTRFGEVVEGMGVVDRITVGDTVRVATWR